MKLLGKDDSPLLKLDERNKTSRSNYQQWRKVVADNMNDVMEYRRIANEANELDQSIGILEAELSEKTRLLDLAKDKSSDLQTEVDELRELLEASKRWAEAASRIAEKRMQVNQKQLDLSISNADVGGRDLKTVEQDLADRMETKDQHSNQVSSDSGLAFGYTGAGTNQNT
jgi:DNA gyrase/topoisomerase IV subunit A